MQNILLEYLEQADYYKSKKDYKSAVDCYEKFINIDSSKVSILTITADLYSKLNGSESLGRQIELYEMAYILQPQNRLVLHGLAFGYEKLGMNDKAKLFYEKLLENNPSENDYYNYGGFLIHCGDFKNGHKYFKHRFNIDDINLEYPADKTKKWDLNTNISDKTLLVHYEQGFGDTIMYSRFVPALKHCAKKIIFKVQNELFDLISNSEIFKDIEIINGKHEAHYDVNMALLDVPYVLQSEASNLPETDKYLNVEQEKVQNFKNEFLQNHEGFKIGLSLCGSKDANYSGRDLELNKVYQILKDIPNVKFYNLQKNGENIEQVLPLGHTFKDFTDSACALKNMDLVVTTDNVILNLAGALGLDTIALFNKETNYRWFKTTGENVGWYKSVKPLQADLHNNWDEVFAKLKSEILNRL